MTMKGQKLEMDKRRNLEKEDEKQDEGQEPWAVFLIDNDYCLQDKTQSLKQESTCPDDVFEENNVKKASKIGDRVIVEVKDEVSDVVNDEVNNQVTNGKEEFKTNIKRMLF